METWKRVPGFPDYEVSDLGRVRSWRIKGNTTKPVTSPRILKQSLCGDRQKYLACKLYSDDKKLPCRVHRLVMEAFIGPMPAGMEVRHLNGNPHDNRLENLRYGSHKENMDDMVAHGTAVNPNGSSHGMAILNEASVLQMRLDAQAGMNYSELGRKYGVHKSAARLIVLRKRWTHI